MVKRALVVAAFWVIVNAQGKVVGFINSEKAPAIAGHSLYEVVPSTRNATARGFAAALGSAPGEISYEAGALRVRRSTEAVPGAWRP